MYHNYAALSSAVLDRGQRSKKKHLKKYYLKLG
jgi:hypothetical protein